MLNSVILIGRLAQDPELRYTQGGDAVANFALAVERPFTNQRGEKEVDFIKVVAWKKQGENVSKYLSKGSLCAVNGRIQVRNYEDKGGIKRTIAEVNADRVVFLDKGGGNKQEKSEEIPF